MRWRRSSARNSYRCAARRFHRSCRSMKDCAPPRDCWQRFGPTQVPLGNCAAVRIGGVDVVLIANRTQALGLELFTNVGIDPLSCKVLVVKSTNHFMAAFGPIAKRVIYIESD